MLFFIHVRREVQAVALDGKGYFHHEGTMDTKGSVKIPNFALFANLVVNGF